MELQAQFEHDKHIWDGCAHAYESAVVLGHPDVTAYEHFEEDLLDRLLHYLIRDRGRQVQLFDVGCGSGRLHVRYGLKSLAPRDERGSGAARKLQQSHARFQFDPVLASGLARVGGLDFSHEMLALAERKLCHNGLGGLFGTRLCLEQGSAFDLEPFPERPLPVVVTLCNSIGVMQGSEGAQRVFQAMCRAVERSGGIALISAYRGEAVADYGLGNYETTLDAGGQPVWLVPNTYAAPIYRQQPVAYKRAFSGSDTVLVDVYDDNGNLVCRGHELKRDEALVRETIATGHIRTHHEYESHWYPTSLFREWIHAFWPAEKAWHLSGCVLDRLRAVPVQLAILDTGDYLGDFFARMGVEKRFDT